MNAIGTAVTLIVALVLIAIVGACVDMICIPVINLFLNITLDPLTIPIVNQVILWSVLAALAIALIVRVVKGVNELIINPTNSSVTVGEWIYKSILTVILVAIMPLLCTMIINLGTMMFTDVQGAVTASGTVTIQAEAIDDEWMNGLAEADFGVVLGTIANSILVCLVVAAAIMVVYQLFKRQFIMLVVSIVATWVSAKAAADSFDDYADVLVSLLALCITQWIQYLFFAIAVVLVNNFIGGVSWLQVDLTSEGAIASYILVLAALGTALAIPAIMERYSFSSGRTGAGNLIVGMAVRGGFRSIGSVARGAGSLVR